MATSSAPAAATSSTPPAASPSTLAKDAEASVGLEGGLPSGTTTSTPTPASPTTTGNGNGMTASPTIVTPGSPSTSSSGKQQSPPANPSPGGATTSPATATSPTAPKPKKKKRRGLAGFFAALGCGGGDELEDVPKEKPARLEKPRPGAVGPAAPSRGAATGGQNTAGTKVTTPPAVVTGSGEASGSKVLGASSGAGIALGGVAAAAGVGGAAAAAYETGRGGKPKEDKENVPPTPTVGGTEGSKDVVEDVLVAPSVPTEVGSFEETEGLTSAAVQPPGSGLLRPSTPHREHSTPSPQTTPTRAGADGGANTHSSLTSGTTEISDDSFLTDTGGEGEGGMVGATYGDEGEGEMDEEDRLIMMGGIGIPVDANGNPAPLLPPMSPEHAGRKCLVLDLDETLLHSSFKMISSADYIVPVEIESQTHNVYVIKRPGVDNFLRKMGEIYEVVVFTASLSKYADPVLDMLDVHRVVKHRLFRESCYNHKGNYVKDLSQLGRDMHSCIIIDNSPASYIFHQNNAVPVSTWFNDPHDTELTDLCPFLTDLETVDDIRGVLDGSSL